MAGLLTYSLKGAFPFHPPKLLKSAKKDFILFEQDTRLFRQLTYPVGNSG
jgi:hypothetical protein